VVENEPFELQETGWGGFQVDIRLFFNPDSNEKPQYRQHFLQLEPYGSEEEKAKQIAEKLVRSEICEAIEFNEPTEALWDALTSPTQWDYLNKDKKGAKKASAILGGATTPEGQRAAGLPEHSTTTNPYSKQMEQHFIDKFEKGAKGVDDLIDEENKKRRIIDENLRKLKEEEKAIRKRLEEIRANKIAGGLTVNPDPLPGANTGAVKKK
jgi:YEATS domain-containing protein 4